MDSAPRLENLPTEVLIHILAHLDDVHCVWNLLASSPASYRVFNQYSKEVFWPAISESAIPSQTQEVIRFILRLRAGAFRETKLDDIVRKVRDREAGIVLGKSEELGYDLPTPGGQPAGSPSPCVLRAVLGLAARVHRLSRSCVDYYLRQLAAAREQGRVEWSAGDGVAQTPSWIEEQRVLRAFWRVQLVLELERAARGSRVAYEPEDAAGIGEKLDVERFYDSSTSNLKAAHHEVMTAVAYLRVLERDEKEARFGTRVRRLPPPSMRSSGDIRPSAVRMPGTSSARRSSLILPADGLWIVDSMSRGAHSPIKYAGFEPYRALGFAIWDRHRLAGMGLASPPGHGRVTGLGSYFFHWLRLLSSEDLVLAEANMREAEAQGGRLRPLQPVIQDNAS